MDSFQVALTAEQYTALQQKVRAEGIAIDANGCGQLPKTSGVLLSFRVTPGACGGANIMFNVEQKPFYVSTSMIESHIDQLLGIG